MKNAEELYKEATDDLEREIEEYVRNRIQGKIVEVGRLRHQRVELDKKIESKELELEQMKAKDVRTLYWENHRETGGWTMTGELSGITIDDLD